MADLKEFLEKLSLAAFLEPLKGEGAEKPEDLKDLSDEDLTKLGLKKLQILKIRRELEQKEKDQKKPAAAAPVVTVDVKAEVDKLAERAKKIPVPPKGSKNIPFPRFEQSFDGFLSYRVNTDAQFVSDIHDKYKIKTAEDENKIRYKKKMAKPYMDVHCLKDGEDWEAGFLNGVTNSYLFVAMMSWHGEDGGSVGQMSKLDPEAGKDWCDNCLLEYEFAYALMNADNSMMFTILPVLYGEKDNRGFTPFPFQNISKLPKVPSIKTKEKLLDYCEKFSIPVAEEQVRMSVRDLVQAFTKRQGVKLFDLGGPLTALESCAAKIRERALESLDLFAPHIQLYCHSGHRLKFKSPKEAGGVESFDCHHCSTEGLKYDRLCCVECSYSVCRDCWSHASAHTEGSGEGNAAGGEQDEEEEEEEEEDGEDTDESGVEGGDDNEEFEEDEVLYVDREGHYLERMNATTAGSKIYYCDHCQKKKKGIRLRCEECNVDICGECEYNYMEDDEEDEFSLKFAIQSRSSGYYLDGRNPDYTNPLVTKRCPDGDKFLQWFVVPVGNGTYALKSVSSKFYLDGRTSGDQDPLLGEGNPEEQTNLQWRLVEVDSGYYALQSVSGGGYMDGRNQDYNNPLLTHRPPQGDQYLHWSLIPLAEQTTSETPYVKVAFKVRTSGACLDGRDKNHPEPFVSARAPEGDNYLQWYMIPTSADTFAFKSVSSEFYLGEEETLTLAEGDPEEDESLQWTLEQVDAGYFALSSCNGSYLDGASQTAICTESESPEENQTLHWQIVILSDKI